MPVEAGSEKDALAVAVHHLVRRALSQVQGGELASFTIGRSRRIPREALEKYIARHSTTEWERGTFGR